MTNILPFMVRNEEQKYISENYVSIPPALIITDEAGAIWTLGFKTTVFGGEFAFNVLRNGIDTGEYANRIERRKSEIWIFGAEGWKRMRVYKAALMYVYGLKATFKPGSKIEPVSIDIYRDDFLDKPAVNLIVNTVEGSHWKDFMHPIECLPDHWLFAVSNRLDMSVVGYVGGENLRAIPIRRGVSV